MQFHLNGFAPGDPQIVDPGGLVLDAATVEEMRWPVTTTDEQLWMAGFVIWAIGHAMAVWAAKQGSFVHFGLPV